MSAPIPTLADNPCGRAEALRAARDELVIGGRAKRVEFEAGNGVRRLVEMSSADLSRLDRLIAEADNACAISQGKRPRRFAITPRGRQ